MNKKDLKAALLASALGGAAFVAPVMAEENSQDPVDVNDQTTQTVTADESTVNDQTTNTESAETNTVKDGWAMMAIIMRMVKWLYLNLRRLMVKRIISKVMVHYVVMEFLI